MEQASYAEKVVFACDAVLFCKAVSKTGVMCKRNSIKAKLTKVLLSVVLAGVPS